MILLERKNQEKKVKIYKKSYNYILLSILITFLLCYQFLSNITNIGIKDWDQTHAWIYSVYKNIYQFKQIPIYNPWECGGMTIIGHGGIPYLQLTYLMAPFTGFISAVKLNLFFYILLAFSGIYLFSKSC